MLDAGNPSEMNANSICRVRIEAAHRKATKKASVITMFTVSNHLEC